jgi:hypothetical protein
VSVEAYFPPTLNAASGQQVEDGFGGYAFAASGFADQGKHFSGIEAKPDPFEDPGPSPGTGETDL